MDLAAALSTPPALGGDRADRTRRSRLAQILGRDPPAVALALLLACGADERPSQAGADEPIASSGEGGAPAGTAGQGGGTSAGAASGGGGAGDVVPFQPSCVPRESCQRLCATFGSDPAGCGLGDDAQCGCLCEERFNGPCPDELDALAACVGDTPSLDCSQRGRVFPGCEEPSFALEACDFRARGLLCAEGHPVCTPYCRATVLAFCPLGPESVASCLCGCEASLVTTCASELDAFMACSAQAPSFTCDASGRPAASTCPSEWTALATCMGLPVETEE